MRERHSVKVNICQQMYEQKFNDKSQVQAHLESLLHMHEQLTSMGVGLNDLDLVTVILSSLPKPYCPLINTINMLSAHAKVTLESIKIMESLIDEFEHLSIEDLQLKSAENTLATAGAHGKSHGKGGVKN